MPDPDLSALTSSKPYLIRGLYQWLLDNDSTPYILVDTSIEGVQIPPSLAAEGKLVLNLAPGAVQDLELDNDYLAFSARFGGVAQKVFCPIAAVLAIYARESGEGMMFSSDEEAAADQSSGAKTQKPGLTIVK